MPTIVGVKLRPTDKVFSFEVAEMEPAQGDVVVVETERGEELGSVVDGPTKVEDSEVKGTLKPIVRVATEEDLVRAKELRGKEKEAMKVYRDLVTQHKLDMKPVDAEYLFDGHKIVFYFTAEERVDFRALVRDLAREFKARIDMRQIGVRDEARMVGGFGHCGQQLCCVRLGGEFQPVSIRMAKAQDLPLNPLKISGLCGRLMCCLRYEYEAYKDYKSRAPKVGAKIETPNGEAKVIGLDAPRETVTLLTGDGRLKIPLSCMCNEGCPGPRPCRVTEEAFAEIEAKEAEKLSANVAAIPDSFGEPPKQDEKKQKSGSRPSSSSRKRRRPRGGRKKSSGDQKKQEGSKSGGQSKQKNPKASGQKNKKDSGTGSGAKSSSSRRRRRRRRPPQDGQTSGTPKQSG